MRIKQIKAFGEIAAFVKQKTAMACEVEQPMQSASDEEKRLESAAGDIPFKPPFGEDFNPFKKEGVYLAS